MTETIDDNSGKIWQSNISFKYSQGVTVNLTPELPPRKVENISYNVTNGRIKFTWQSADEFEIWFKEVKSKTLQAPYISQPLNKIDELLGSGLVMKSVKALEQTCEFERAA
mgnify:CR=1 FL=1